jgi:hypothetical protein
VINNTERMSADVVIERLFQIALELRAEEITNDEFKAKIARYMPPKQVLPFCRVAIDPFDDRETQYTLIRRFVVNRLATVDVAPEVSPLMIALGELVKLQAHYAGLLNQYDGGQRHPFANAEEWLDRLKELGKLPK